MAPPWNAHVIKTLTEENIYIYIYSYIFLFLHLSYQLNVTSILILYNAFDATTRYEYSGWWF